MDITIIGQKSKAQVHLDNFSGYYIKMPAGFQNASGVTQVLGFSTDAGSVDFTVPTKEEADQIYDQLVDKFKNKGDLTLRVTNIVIS